MDLKFKVTMEKINQHLSTDDFFHYYEMTKKEMYEFMTNFLVDENGEYLTVEQARKVFKKIPLGEWPEYVAQFRKAVGDAFVSPTNGG